MKPTFDSKPHPIIVCAVLLGVLLVAGCGQDDGPMSMQNPAMSQSYGQGAGFRQGARNAQGPGYAQSPGYFQGVDPGQGPGNEPGRGEPGNPGMPDRMGGERGGARLDVLMTWERRDMGVGATRELHSGAMHGPTPNQIPGGQVITTKGLLPLLQQGIPVYVFDVLGTEQTLPNAIPASFAAEPGSFDDDTQQELAQMLQQVTRGNQSAPLVFYCQGPQCWMSYNAALRTIALGYRNVLWYRGGMEAWNHAGQQFVSAQRQG